MHKNDADQSIPVVPSSVVSSVAQALTGFSNRELVLPTFGPPLNTDAGQQVQGAGRQLFGGAPPEAWQTAI